MTTLCLVEKQLYQSLLNEELEDTKGVIRNRKSQKDKQHNS